MLTNAKLPESRPVARRPKLTAETAVDYLDWVLEHIDRLPAQQVDRHIQAAELAIRTMMSDAQAKATQHTLVEQGVIAPPPTAS